MTDPGLGAARSPRAEPSHSSSDAEDAPGPRVLIVDDDANLRTLLRSTLSEDFAIAEARDGRHALELVDSFAPDLVLLDWQMPGQTGAEVLEVVKRGARRVAVIVVTAEHGARSRQLAASLGADAFLTKPFSPLELLRTVERLVQ